MFDKVGSKKKNTSKCQVLQNHEGHDIRVDYLGEGRMESQSVSTVTK